MLVLSRRFGEVVWLFQAPPLVRKSARINFEAFVESDDEVCSLTGHAGPICPVDRRIQTLGQVSVARTRDQREGRFYRVDYEPL